MRIKLRDYSLIFIPLIALVALLIAGLILTIFIK